MNKHCAVGKNRAKIISKLLENFLKKLLLLLLLLRAQERPATLILTVIGGLRITRARHVYNRDAETGN